MASFRPQHLRRLREVHGYSQDQLGNEIEVSRPTYVQIEKGERELTISEAQKLASIFGMTMDDFLNGKEVPTVVLEKSKDASEKESDVRISVPQKNIAKFKEVLLYILEKVGAKPNVGETVIYKLLYFIDFDFYEKFERQLVGATYQRNHYGPTPCEFKSIVEEMQKNGEVEKVKGKRFDFPQTKYLPLRKANLSILSAEELRHIDEELVRLSDKAARELSDFSHGDMPWKAAKENGKILDYEMVFYREPPYSVGGYDDDPL